MQMIIPNSIDTWLIVAVAVFALFLCFGIKLSEFLKKENERHHFIVWSDDSIEALYDMDDESDLI